MDDLILESDLEVSLLNNKQKSLQGISRKTHPDFIHLYFQSKGKSELAFNNGAYTLPLPEGQVYLIYNPTQRLSYDLNLSGKSALLCIFISFQKLHDFFKEHTGAIPFLEGDNAQKKYYAQREISPAVNIVLDQIFHFNLHPSVKSLFIKGKVYELLGHFFNKGENPNEANCPFLHDEEVVRKIRQAKEILLHEHQNPPSMEQLSQRTGLNLYKLKEGFKNVYGQPVFTYLNDYRMEKARQMLETRQHQVNEVAFAIGYSNPSHFITAFKKKYHITPKKYISSIAHAEG